MDRTYNTRLYIERILSLDPVTNYPFNFIDTMTIQLCGLIKQLEQDGQGNRELLVGLLQALTSDVIHADEPEEWREAGARARARGEEVGDERKELDRFEEMKYLRNSVKCLCLWSQSPDGLQRVLEGSQQMWTNWT